LHDVVEATGTWPDIEEYLKLRAGGASDREARDVKKHNLHTDSYVAARQAGASHSGIVRYSKYSRAIQHVGPAMEAGATARQMCAAARQQRLSMENYVELRRAGASHWQALRVHWSTVNLFSYKAMREAGMSHRKALRVLKRPLSWRGYVAERWAGLRQHKALRAASPALRRKLRRGR
jgi:hypothetical protein